MQRIALIYGGESSEHSVSCVTAVGVTAAIDTTKYQVIHVGITKGGRFVLEPVNPEWKLADHPAVSEDSPELLLPLGGGELRMASGISLGKIDLAFPVLHGPNGEDGSIQGLLQLCKIPYVGNGVMASAVAMDKVFAKALFREAGLAVADQVVVSAVQWQNDRSQALKAAQKICKPDAFVKPSRSGSSVGVSLVKTAMELEAAIELALQHDSTALIEERIKGREIECSVLEQENGELEVSVPGEIVVTGSDFYDYEAKYLGSGAELIIPAAITDREKASLSNAAIVAFRALGCTGLARTDFFLTKKGWVITEVNTMPGFTPISMYPALFEVSGVSYQLLVERLIQNGFQQGMRQS
ncbi:MAG: D-alanine--D-alanine ligase [Aquiluna sp.]|nr:D-alanine--D-alanine ligase [Aquiluna sp.]